MADYGFKVSRDGFNVKTCEKKDLVASSEHNMLKTKTVQEVDSGLTYSHGLGYTPLFFATVEFAAGKRSIIGDTTSSSLFDIGLCYADSTEVKNATNYDNAKFYIFYNQ